MSCHYYPYTLNFILLIFIKVKFIHVYFNYRDRSYLPNVVVMIFSNIIVIDSKLQHNMFGLYWHENQETTFDIDESPLLEAVTNVIGYLTNHQGE